MKLLIKSVEVDDVRYWRTEDVIIALAMLQQMASTDDQRELINRFNEAMFKASQAPLVNSKQSFALRAP